jgi:hypothetical protein
MLPLDQLKKLAGTYATEPHPWGFAQLGLPAATITTQKTQHLRLGSSLVV